MRVLISDNLGEVGVQMLRDAEGIEVDVNTGLSPEELKEIIGGYDGLVIRSATKVTAELLEAAKNLKVVGRAGIGLDNVDIKAATDMGVVVMNTPGGNVVTTAEHAIAMMMSLTRNIPRATAGMKAGRWEKKLLQGRELFQKTMGVIGYGNIGSVVADRAKGLKMRVVVYDPMVSPEVIEKKGFDSVSLEELYKRSDYISIHVPKISQTAYMINQDAFSMMKQGVMLINCARGGIVDEDALVEALKSGKVGGAALDVFDTEPPGEHPLLAFDNVICTPHLGASTREAQINVAVAVADQIIKYLNEETIINAVNVPSVTGDLLKVLNPWLQLGDRMGCLLSQLTSGHYSEVHIEYQGNFEGLYLAPVTTAVLKGLLAPVLEYEVNSVNAPVLAEKMGIKVVESNSSHVEDFVSLLTVKLVTDEKTTTVNGSIFGQSEPRVVKIDKFRLEMYPKGHLALINNVDKPGSIGSIGTVLGRHRINIERMMVGHEEGGDNNFIFLEANQPIPESVARELSDLELVKTVIPIEL